MLCSPSLQLRWNGPFSAEMLRYTDRLNTQCPVLLLMSQSVNHSFNIMTDTLVMGKFN